MRAGREAKTIAEVKSEASEEDGDIREYFVV